MRTFFFLALTIFAIPIFAQTTISFQDYQRNPIINAHIQFDKQEQRFISDENGEITIPFSGKHLIYVQHINFEDYQQDLELKGKPIHLYLQPKSISLNTVIISAIRVSEKDPITASNLTKDQINTSNMGQDMPILLNNMTSVVTTSDAGAGVGYTGIRVRGSDATRVNVTINGVPLNDAESHGVYWVDIPDIASNTQSLQLQRGVGASTNGSGAFGASLNLNTDGLGDTYTSFSAAVGSFNTQKYNVKFHAKTGKHLSWTSSFTTIQSDGYIDRASSDLQSYYVAGTYHLENLIIKAIAFGGHEKTYQSWNGTDSYSLENDRTFNSAGAIYDTNWTVLDYYDNEVDDYGQNHFQLHFSREFNSNSLANLTLFYTKGKGFYESYKQGENPADYSLLPNEEDALTDLIRQKWLDNDFFGGNLSWKYQNGKWNTTNGLYFGQYNGDHFGKVIWANNATIPTHNQSYYENFGDKTDFNIFSKHNYAFTNKLNTYLDLQYRYIDYTMKFGKVKNDNNIYHFFNPKIGLNYQINPLSSLYSSFAVGNKEPNRTDFEYSIDKPQFERLYDLELGYKLRFSKHVLATNLFYMYYLNQLVLTGEIDDSGSPIRKNVGNSYRSGLEVEAAFDFNNFKWYPNFTLAIHQNQNYYEVNENQEVTSFGNTSINYSPNIIGSSVLEYHLPTVWFSLESKYVGSQFLGNNGNKNLKLDAYFVNNFQANWRANYNNNEAIFSFRINNLLDTKYSSNGYLWGTTPYYYPQAGIHFMGKVSIVF